MSSRVKKKLLSSTAASPRIEPKAETTTEPLPERADTDRLWINAPREDGRAKTRKKACRATPIRAGPDPLIEPLALSIKQFCAAHSICVETFYRMQRAGAGPSVMKVGARTLISVEAAATWRREREEAARKQRCTATTA
jgi:hypothetical protein